MIFNSITREINQNQRSRYTNSNPNNQPSYFPQRTYIANQVFQKMPEPTYPRQKHQSNLAKMNNKITENIEYLRYKDQSRVSELKSSRVSYSSNRSNRSNRSNDSKSIRNTVNSNIPSKSNTSSQIRSYLPSQKSHIKSFVPQNYQQGQRTSTNYNNYWKRQHNDSYNNKYTTDQVKYFTRNPITISASSYLDQSKKMATPQRDNHHQAVHSVISNKSDYFYDFPNQQKKEVKQNFIRTEGQKPVDSRDWNASFGDSIRYSKINSSEKQRTASFQNKQTHTKTQVVVQNKPSVSPLVNSKPSPSPSPSSSPSSKSGIIISAGLIALGLIILLLQIIK